MLGSALQQARLSQGEPVLIGERARVGRPHRQAAVVAAAGLSAESGRSQLVERVGHWCLHW